MPRARPPRLARLPNVPAVRLSSRRSDADADVIRARLRALLEDRTGGGMGAGRTTSRPTGARVAGRRRRHRATADAADDPPGSDGAIRTAPACRPASGATVHRVAPPGGIPAGRRPVAVDRGAGRRPAAGRLDLAGPPRVEPAPAASGRREPRRASPTRRRRRSGRPRETSAAVVVSVVGLVAGRGWSPCPAGARVADAVQAAGGLLPEADPASVNLAALVTDGAQIAVGVPGAAAGPGGGGARPRWPGAGSRVDLNTRHRGGAGRAAGHRAGPRPADRGPPHPPRAVPDRRRAGRRAGHRPGHRRGTGRTGRGVSTVRSTVPEAAAAGRWVWVDLRLAPVAAAVWAVSAAAPLLTPTQLALGAAGATGLAAAVARRADGRAAAVALAVLAGLAVAHGDGGRPGGRRGRPRRSAPLAEAGRTVELVLELDADPHVLPGSAGRRVVADATVTALTDGPVTHRLDADVLLFAPADGWRDLPPGQPVRVRAALSAPRPGDDVGRRGVRAGPADAAGRARRTPAGRGRAARGAGRLGRAGPGPAAGRAAAGAGRR